MPLLTLLEPLLGYQILALGGHLMSPLRRCLLFLRLLLLCLPLVCLLLPLLLLSVSCVCPAS